VRLAKGEPLQVSVPVLDLLRSPDGPRDRQLILGETLRRFETHNGWDFVQSDKDGYVGYIKSGALGLSANASHWVSVAATHVYEQPNLKSRDRLALSFGSKLAEVAKRDQFLETAIGFVPLAHLSAVDEFKTDPVAVADLFLGTPYLWGGNSRFGIDCSGLVQAAVIATGRTCPGDSDLQQEEVGHTLPAGTTPERGDLLFWPGHVAWVSGPDQVLHANAHHMAVQYEPLSDAVTRIEAQGDGPVTSHKRL
ncbi:MAG: NlpC/P60 family protein, partial [Pseudomonadota bacterium]